MDEEEEPSRATFNKHTSKFFRGELEKPDLLLKTLRGMEQIVASRILEIESGIHVQPKPQNFSGLVLVGNSKDKHVLYKRIKEEIPEAEKVFLVDAYGEAELNKIVDMAKKVVYGRIGEEETFAVRTTRRGTHSFTSIDVNVAVGDAVRKTTHAEVNLNFPDKILWVEIIGDLAVLSLTSGLEEHKKKAPDKTPVLPILKKMSIVQMPYLGPLKSAKEFGMRIGRCVQTFEVGELIVGFVGCINGLELLSFLQGVREGIESRYNIQIKSYQRQVSKVPVYVQDLYQLVRDRRGEPIIVFEPEGEKIGKLGEELVKLFKSGKRVNMLVGSREGIPSGVYRFANLVVDLTPNITISTDFAASSAIIACLTLLEEHGFLGLEVKS